MDANFRLMGHECRLTPPDGISQSANIPLEKDYYIPYLSAIDEQALERFERLVEQIKQAEGINQYYKTLKAENALK